MAWSVCLTPLLGIGAAWSLEHAIANRKPWFLLLTGLLSGLALQAHPSFAAVLPGLAVYLLWRGWRFLKGPQIYLAGLVFIAAFSNVLIYNIRPQAMQRLKLSYADVAAVNPRIIYVGAYGYGQQGPYAARPAYDDLIQGMTGLPWLMQQAGAADPRYIPATLADRTRPTVLGTAPADNASSVAWNANLLLTFSEPVLAGSGNVVLHRAGVSWARTIACYEVTQRCSSG